MGVRNYAILFLGLPSDEIGIPDFVPENEHDLYEEDPREWIFWAEEDERNPKGLTTQMNNEDELLIGFEIGNSGAYGCRVIDDCEDKLEMQKEQFFNAFGKEPKLYLLNYRDA